LNTAQRARRSALQQAADDTRQPLSAIESLTDPSMHSLGGGRRR